MVFLPRLMSNGTNNANTLTAASVFSKYRHDLDDQGGPNGQYQEALNLTVVGVCMSDHFGYRIAADPLSSYRVASS